MPSGHSAVLPATAAPDLLDGILDASLNGIMAYSAVRDDRQIVDFRIIRFNQVALRMLSLPDDAVGKTLLTLFPGVQAAGLFEQYVAVVETGEPLRRQLPYYYEGLEGWYEIAAVRLNDGFVITFLDVTEQRLAKERLEQQAELLEGILHNSLDGLAAVQAVRNADGRIVDFTLEAFNQALTGTSSLSPEQLQGASLLAIDPTLKPSGLFDQYVTVCETGEAYQGEYHYGLNGRWFSIKAARRAPDRLVITVTDINEVKLAARQLEEQATLLRGILDNSLNGLMSFATVRDAQGEIVDFLILTANQVAQAFMRAPIDELRGRKLIEMYPIHIPTGLFALYKTTVETQQPQRMEAYMDLTGYELWLDVAAAPLPDGLVVTFLDITETKRAQQATIGEAVLFKALSNNVPDAGVLVCNPGTGFRILYANGDLPPVFSGTDQQSLTNRRLDDVVQAAWLPAIRQGFLEALSGRSRQQEDVIGEQYYEVYFTPVLNQQEQTVMAMATFRNVTPTRRFQQQLQEYVTELQKSNANLEQFAYVASHDLQEPLRKITAFGDVLQQQYRDALGSNGTDIVNRMQSAAGRMQVLIRDLLTYSRLTRATEPFQAVELNRLIAEVVTDLETVIQDKNADLQIGSMPTVRGHALQLRQLFQNLLSNALKFTKPAGEAAGERPRVVIGCRAIQGRESELVPPEQAKQRFYLITVTDNGIGFDPKHTERIFQVFQRLHGRQQYAGTGVGLAIVRKVVENHRGYLGAEGRPGAGATFKILLPSGNV